MTVEYISFQEHFSKYFPESISSIVKHPLSISACDQSLPAPLPPPKKKTKDTPHDFFKTLSATSDKNNY